MFRMTTLKISLFSALATLMLLIAMLASSGTASAHTASSQARAFPHPYIEAHNVMPIYGNCEEVSLDGFGFTPGQIKLFASQHNHPLSVQPGSIFTNGSFSTDVTVCGDFGWGHGYGWGHGHGWGHGYGYCSGFGYGWGQGYCLGYAPMVLVAIDPYGVPSNHVTLY